MKNLLEPGFYNERREIAINSPYFEAIKQKDYEVLFLFEPHDEVVIIQLNEFQKKKLTSIEQDIETSKDKDDLIIEGKADPAKSKIY